MDNIFIFWLVIILIFTPFPWLFLLIFLEFILRLFGKSFDDEPKKEKNK